MAINRTNLQKPFWAIAVDEVIQILNASSEGLTNEEVKIRLDRLGRNVLPKGERATGLRIFLSQFKSPLIGVLVAAFMVTVVMADYKDAIFILAAVIANTILGFYQESKAETALQNLTSYIKERVRVVRDNKEVEIDAEEVVHGDILRLIQGSRIPADARLTYVNNLMIDESILTGESLPAQKSIEPVHVDAAVADRSSMVWGGTLVDEGLGLAVVTATASETEIGKIAVLVKREREKTPLQVAIGKFAKNALIILGIFTTILFILGVSSGYGTFEMFVISVAVAVAAVPEGLPIALTVVLAVGVERLAKRKGVVRKLLAAETLGSTTIILTDKTGTLTEAKMELEQVIPAPGVMKEEVLELAILNTDVIIENPDEKLDGWRLVGRPLEVSLVRSAAKYKVLLRDVGKKFKVVDRKTFNSSDKFSAVQLEYKGNKFWNYLGAPEKLLEKSKVSEKEKEHFIVAIDDLAYAGYRVLGVSRDHFFLGLLAFRDPIRLTVKRAIDKIKTAGVRMVIVTGDHKGTAETVAKELGIDVLPDEVMTGPEILAIDDDELRSKLHRIKIFARVTPEDKLRLVKLYKDRGEVVAVTGDGINDAPALKEADIGIAVGSGTDVAKGASDLIVLDDNFETIVAAIEEGRRILANIKKAIVYLLSNSLDSLLLIGGAFIVGVSLPLNALQILYVNFFTDSFPAVAFAFENGENHLREKPPKLRERLFDSRMRFLILVVGVSTSFLLFFMYLILLRLGFEETIVKSFIFASFALYTLFLSFSVRSLKTSILRYSPFSNPYLVVGAAVGFGLTLAAIYLPPLQNLFGTTALPLPWFLGVIAFGFLNIFAVEVVKYIFRNK